MLSQFKKVDIVWGGVNDRIHDRITLLQGSENGRILTVQVLDGSKVVDMKGIDLGLIWQSQGALYSGKEKFNLVDKDKSIYELTPSEKMVRSAGKLECALELSAKDESPIVSLPFEIDVIKGVSV